jgi:hypothetical protein
MVDWEDRWQMKGEKALGRRVSSPHPAHSAFTHTCKEKLRGPEAGRGASNAIRE